MQFQTYPTASPPGQPALMPVTQYLKDEFARFAAAAFKDGREDVGRLYTIAAALPEMSYLSCHTHDALTRQWRGWLVFNKY